MRRMLSVVAIVFMFIAIVLHFSSQQVLAEDAAVLAYVTLIATLVVWNVKNGVRKQ